MLIETSSHRPGVVLDTSFGKKKIELEKQLQEDYPRWIVYMMACCSDLAIQASTTVSEWDSFEKECLGLFPNDLCFPLTHSIGQTISRIKGLKDRLNELKGELKQNQVTVRHPWWWITIPSVCHMTSTNNQTIAELPPGSGEQWHGEIRQAPDFGHNRKPSSSSPGPTSNDLDQQSFALQFFMPAVLNMGLFSIPQDIMPFTMNFSAFVKSFFGLACLVALVWGVLSQLSALFYAFEWLLRSVDEIFQAYIHEARKPADTHDRMDQPGDGVVGRDRGLVETATSTSSEAAWDSRLEYRTHNGAGRRQVVQGQPVELQGIEIA